MNNVVTSSLAKYWPSPKSRQEIEADNLKFERDAWLKYGKVLVDTISDETDDFLRQAAINQAIEKFGNR